MRHAQPHRLARLAWRLHPARPERVYRSLRETEWLSPDALEALQLSALDDLLLAARAVPFYRRRLDASGVAPGDLRSLDDLTAIPPLDRRDVQDGIGRLRRGAIAMRRRTSGSTGRPVTVYWSLEMARWADAIERRSKEWLGIGVGDRQVYVRAGGSRSPLARLHRRVRNLRLVAPASLTDPKRRREIVDALVRDQPVVVGGNATGLYTLALAVLEDRRTPMVKVCLSSGNRLPDHYRRAIEAAFACPLYERYGAIETGLIAHPCPEAGSLHVAAEGTLVEVVRDDGSPAPAGEIGHVLVTCWRNRALPLIRYRIGDLAIKHEGSCGCGRGLPVLERIVGRTNDLLRTASGGALAPEAVSRRILAIGGDSVVEFQVVQAEDGGIAVRVVQRERGSPAARRRRIASALDELVGTPGATVVERVEEIPASAGGKLRHIVSNAEAEASGARREV